MRFKCIAVGIIILTALGVWQVRAGQGSGGKKEGGQDAADLVRHGEYLVSSAGMCGDCHTPQDDQGRPERTKLLRGATLPIRPTKQTRNWADDSPDITGGGLASEWSEAEMVKFLMTGVDPDGMKASPPMPAFRLNARDARAAFLYLKSVPGQQKAGREGKGKDSERKVGNKPL
jgi:hypothetical protein